MESIELDISLRMRDKILASVYDCELQSHTMLTLGAISNLNLSNLNGQISIGLQFQNLNNPKEIDLVRNVGMKLVSRSDSA